MNLFGYILLRTIFCVIQALPRDVLEQVSRVLAWVMTFLIPIRRRVCMENLQSVFPEASHRQLDSIINQMWQSLFLMLFEVAQAPRTINRYNWRTYITIRDQQVLLTGLLSKHPTMLLSGHYGNFELAGFIAGLFGFPSFTIARPLDNPLMNQYINAFRSRYGQFILPKKGIATTVDSLLRRGETLTVLADQSAGKKGIWMDFMGRPASCHKALALYALTTDAEVVVVAARHNWRMFDLTLDCRGHLHTAKLGSTERTIPHVTAWYNRQLEEAIELSPAQYWWLHRRWKDPRKQKAAKLTDDS
ncbi:MAG: lysophospholipid acyltransferase family protein [Pirellulales bacterium]|nr:lysophospholipid acyltransferase family protein [Pirellulales bacterium]